MPISSHEPINYIELTKHTLLVAQTKDARVQLLRECLLADKSAVENILTAVQPTWKTLGLRAITALAPVPAYWHRASAAEASLHRTEDALRKFGTNLPHGLTGDLELTACHAADGTLVSPDGHARWLLGLTSESNLALAHANAFECRIESVRSTSATLGHIGAITHSLNQSEEESVILWDLASDRSHLFLVTSRGVQAVVPCAVGLEDIFTAVQSAHGLSFRGAASRLFYDPAHDFTDVAPKIAAYIAPALKTAFAAFPIGDVAPQLACTGLTGRQSWFVYESAVSIDLLPWTPKISSFCSNLKLQFASHEIAVGVTPASLGLLDLVASDQQGNAVWHPTWSRVGIARLATAAPFFAPPLPAAAAPLAPSASDPGSISALSSEPVSPRKPAPRVKPSLRLHQPPPPVQSIKLPASKPALAPKMPEKTVARLRYEAYAQLCRESFTDSLLKLEIEKKHITATRPPFGVFGTKKAVDSYESSLRSAQDLEIKYRQQLKELEPIEHWLQSTLQDLLHEYLEVANPEYHDYSEVCQLVERWQNYVGELHEVSMGFAREARLTGTLIGNRVPSDSLQLKETVANLRTVASHLHAQTVRIDLITKEVARLGAAGNLPLAMPELPTFPPGTWVDRVMLLRPAECLRELKKQEEVARAFYNAGKNDLLLRAEAIRSKSLRARLDELNKYWDNLRPRVLEQCEAQTDMNKMLTELQRSYVADSFQRQQEAGTNAPFSLVH